VLTDEPVLEPPIRLKEALKNANLPENSFITIKIGESIQIDSK